MSNRRKSDGNKKMESLRLVQQISTVLFIHKRMNLKGKKRIIKEIKKIDYTVMPYTIRKHDFK